MVNYRARFEKWWTRSQRIGVAHLPFANQLSLEHLEQFEAAVYAINRYGFTATSNNRPVPRLVLIRRYKLYRAITRHREPNVFSRVLYATSGVHCALSSIRARRISLPWELFHGSNVYGRAMQRPMVRMWQQLKRRPHEPGPTEWIIDRARDASTITNVRRQIPR